MLRIVALLFLTFCLSKVYCEKEDPFIIVARPGTQSERLRVTDEENTPGAGERSSARFRTGDTSNVGNGQEGGDDNGSTNNGRQPSNPNQGTGSVGNQPVQGVRRFAPNDDSDNDQGGRNNGDSGNSNPNSDTSPDRARSGFIRGSETSQNNQGRSRISPTDDSENGQTNQRNNGDDGANDRGTQTNNNRGTIRRTAPSDDDSSPVQGGTNSNDGSNTGPKDWLEITAVPFDPKHPEDKGRFGGIHAGDESNVPGAGDRSSAVFQTGSLSSSSRCPSRPENCPPCRTWNQASQCGSDRECGSEGFVCCEAFCCYRICINPDKYTL